MLLLLLLLMLLLLLLLVCQESDVLELRKFVKVRRVLEAADDVIKLSGLVTDSLTPVSVSTLS